MTPHAFGYDPDPAGAEAFAATLPHPTLAQAGPDLVSDGKTEAHLWPALLQCSPGWKRGSQGNVGSCVGWGTSLAVDLTAACDIVYRREPEVWRGRTIEASLYGFSRVEARGQRVNNGGDGSTGFHAAKSIRELGCLHYGVDYGGTVIPESGKQQRDRAQHHRLAVLPRARRQQRAADHTQHEPRDQQCRNPRERGKLDQVHAQPGGVA